jgi:hypothetical protein
MSELASAQIIVPHVMELIQPRSVLHVGCGRGVWLSVFQECGVTDVWGMGDAPPDPADWLIPPERFQPFDINLPFCINRRFDLVVCLERGQHLAKESASTFVKSLTDLTAVVLFSAGVPYQDGTDFQRPNEQWPEFWAELFRDAGFEGIDAIRPRVWSNQYVDRQYAQNTLLFVREDNLAQYPHFNDAPRTHGGQLPSLVHPDGYLALAEQVQAERKKLTAEAARLREVETNLMKWTERLEARQAELNARLEQQAHAEAELKHRADAGNGKSRDSGAKRLFRRLRRK